MPFFFPTFKKKCLFVFVFFSGCVDSKKKANQFNQFDFVVKSRTFFKLAEKQVYIKYLQNSFALVD